MRLPTLLTVTLQRPRLLRIKSRPRSCAHLSALLPMLSTTFSTASLPSTVIPPSTVTSIALTSMPWSWASLYRRQLRRLSAKPAVPMTGVPGSPDAFTTAAVVFSVEGVFTADPATLSGTLRQAVARLLDILPPQDETGSPPLATTVAAQLADNGVPVLDRRMRPQTGEGERYTDSGVVPGGEAKRAWGAQISPICSAKSRWGVTLLDLRFRGEKAEPPRSLCWL